MKQKIGLAVGLFILTAGFLFAETISPTEYEIKAAFLYNFAKFVEWPPDALQKNPGNFVIGILGHDPFGNDLDDQLEGKTIQDKKIVLKRISDLQSVSSCNVLFISASKDSDLESILSTLKGLPVLTVSDMDQFVQRGGVVGFSVEGKKVRFSVNTKASDAAGLKVSSQLLKLAKRVISRLPETTKYVWSLFKTILSDRS